MQPDLKPTEKLIYWRLVQFAGKNGTCFPSQERLASELALELRTVRAGISRLKSYGLIRVLHRGSTKGRRRLANAYKFIRHAIFDRQSAASQTDDRTAKEPTTYRHGRAGTSDDLQAKNSTTYRHESHGRTGTGVPPNPSLNPSENPKPASSSSSAPFESIGKTEGATEKPPPTTTALCEGQNQNPKTSCPDELLKPWREWLYSVRYPRGDGRRPDAEYARKLLGLFSSAESAEAYMRNWKPKRFKSDNYGLFEADIKTWEAAWPESRRDLEARAAEAQEREAAELREAGRMAAYEAAYRHALDKGWRRIDSLACPNCAGFGRNPDTEAVCSCSAGREFARLAEYCGRCRDQGTIDTEGSEPAFPILAWCACVHAERKRAEEPEYVERFNADSAKRRAEWNGRDRAPRPAAKVQPITDGANLERRLAEELEERVSGDDSDF